MSIVTIGQIPVRQPDEVVYTQNGSPLVVHAWRGPFSLMQGLIAQLRPQYDEVQVSTEEGVSTVRAVSRRPIGQEVEAPIINFDLQPESQAVGLEFAPYYAPLQADEVTAVNKMYNDSRSYADKLTYLTSNVDASRLTLATNLLNDKERGQTDYQEYSFSFTRNIAVSRYWSTTFDFSEHGKVWSSDSLNSYISAGQFGATIPLFTLPTKAETAEQLAANIAWGWMKYQSQVSWSSTGTFNITEGWRLAMWNNRVYDSNSTIYT